MLNHTRTPRNQQQKFFEKTSKIFSITTFYDYMTQGIFAKIFDEFLPSYRNRIYTPLKTLSLFIEQVLNDNGSCQKSVNQVALNRIQKNPVDLLSTNTGGYCKARQRLPLDLIRTLTYRIGDFIEEEVPEQWLWNGRCVKVVDGTTAQCPDTKENQAKYPQPSSQKEGLGFPQCRIVGITSLATGTMLDACFGPIKGKGSDEQSMLRSLYDNNINHGDILLGDAYFSSYFCIADIKSRNADILMEQYGARKKSTDFRIGKKNGRRDHIIILKKPKIRPDWMTLEHYDTVPESLTIREFKSGGKLLVTTLLCPKNYPKKELSNLYASRWNIELDIRAIKTIMGMDELRCKSPEMIEKEFWVYMLAYNFIRVVMAQAAYICDTQPRKLSFKHAVVLWLNAMESIHLWSKEQLFAFFKLIAQQRVGNRPGRTEPRERKKRPKKFPLLTKPRNEKRDEIMINWGVKC